ncbi:class I SAM-dependent RNA methyltransferase [Mycolicibacterium sediminis]|uniref:23S rRNA methyltransferase n=1 Tax=Mycolicibacterium sediminis TaxID=1286180 RepID=A0A7I7QTF4_9MYCO|nr:class I SAM-dependent RNA methyltransferase [Mycolicibacterium sediminis]BBY29505.1 23S rRNA methyltransferase [Mycolicibacterium sediminis]
MSDVTLEVTVGDAANGGSCIARHDGRVIFTRYALPGERVVARVTDERAKLWHASAIEILDPSPDRVDSLCPIAGVDGSGCCDLAFADPAAARRIKGDVVANQLGRLGGFEWSGPAEAVDDDGATGWRTRVRLDTTSGGRAGFHRYHSAELVTDLRCAQLPDGMLDGLDGPRWPAGAELHVAVDDDGVRHVVQTGPKAKRDKPSPTQVVEGRYEAVQRVGNREWHVPVTAFWQAHRGAATLYSDLVARYARLEPGMTAWDLYGGAGVFAAVMADAVGETGSVLTVDTSRGSARAARAALADVGWVQVVTESVRRALSAQPDRADVAVLDPPRTGAGREIIEQLASAGVPRIVHIGCEAASFARDVGLYLANGYEVEELRVFDSFPLTHHVECVAVLSRA